MALSDFCKFGQQEARRLVSAPPIGNTIFIQLPQVSIAHQELLRQAGWVDTRQSSKSQTPVEAAQWPVHGEDKITMLILAHIAACGDVESLMNSRLGVGGAALLVDGRLTKRRARSRWGEFYVDVQLCWHVAIASASGRACCSVVKGSRFAGSVA